MFGEIKNPKNGIEIVRLDEVCTKITDGTHQTPEYTDKDRGYKFLSSKDVIQGYINWKDVAYIPPQLHEKLYKRVAPQVGDILLAKNGTTGIAALVDKNEVFDIYVSLALLRHKPDINPVYLLYAINCEATKQQFDEGLIGMGVPNLHLNVIKRTKILKPEIKFQNEFATFVDELDCMKLKAQEKISALQQERNLIIEKYFV